MILTILTLRFGRKTVRLLLDGKRATNDTPNISSHNSISNNNHILKTQMRHHSNHLPRQVAQMERTLTPCTADMIITSLCGMLLWLNNSSSSSTSSSKAGSVPLPVQSNLDHRGFRNLKEVYSLTPRWKTTTMMTKCDLKNAFSSTAVIRVLTCCTWH